MSRHHPAHSAANGDVKPKTDSGDACRRLKGTHERAMYFYSPVVTLHYTWAPQASFRHATFSFDCSYMLPFQRLILQFSRSLIAVALPRSITDSSPGNILVFVSPSGEVCCASCSLRRRTDPEMLPFDLPGGGGANCALPGLVTSEREGFAVRCDGPPSGCEGPALEYKGPASAYGSSARRSSS
jgi:hypothetical protein